MPNFSPESNHALLLENAPRVLAFNEERCFDNWRRQLEEKLRDLVGWMPKSVPLALRLEWERENSFGDTSFLEKRFVFTSEANADVPCHLLIPGRGQPPFPVVICLQGHTSGMHLSLGRAQSKDDEKMIAEGDRDFAIQVVREGYAALVLEQRCFGERSDRRPASKRVIDHPCHHAALVALLLGRTMIGERVWDVSRAIDALSAFPEVDTARIGCMGNSGGGMITYYAACLEPRIGIAMPSCYVCTFRDSLGSHDHCIDNYLPGALRYFEMADLTGLIAPRSLVVVAGRDDGGFPLHGVEEAFSTIRRIYAAAGVPERCQLVVGEGGHRFFAEPAWPVFRQLSGW